MEVEKLKAITVGDIQTKVVALGVGNGVIQAEISIIASAPQAKNAILVQDFSSLTAVQQRLRIAITTG